MTVILGIHCNSDFSSEFVTRAWAQFSRKCWLWNRYWNHYQVFLCLFAATLQRQAFRYKNRRRTRRRKMSFLWIYVYTTDFLQLSQHKYTQSTEKVRGQKLLTCGRIRWLKSGLTLFDFILLSWAWKQRYVCFSVVHTLGISYY